MADAAVGQKILVVDDSSTSRLMIKTRLARSGYQILEAASGAEAVQMARAHQPSLLLLDYFLPDMTGAQVLTQLKADAATQRVPVIVLSGNDSEEDVRSCESLGAAGFLLKPYEPEDLLQKVSDALAAG